MKKKIISFVLALCLIVPCMFLVSACGNNFEPLSKAEMAVALKSVAKKSWEQLGAGDPTQDQTLITALSANKASFMSYDKNTLPDEMTEQTDQDNVTGIKALGSTMIAIVYMIGEYYENEDFVVSDKVVNFVANMVDPNSQEVYGTNLSLLPKVDKANNKVTLEMFLTSDHMQSLTYNHVESYYYFSVDFDFKSERMLSFYALNVQQNITSQNKNSEEFNEIGQTADGKIVGNVTESDNFKTACRKVFSDFKDEVSQGLTLTGNFDKEFNNYTANSNRAYQAFYQN